MSIKGLLYSNLNLEMLKCQSTASALQSQSRVVEMAFKGLLYLNLELLKCRSKVFSTSIWSCWDVNQGLLYFDLEFVEMAIQGFSTSICSVACKKSKFGGRLLNYESFLIPLFFFFFRYVIFICSFLIWIFIKKSLIGKRFYFWETFDFWNLEVLKLTFKILRLLNLEILTWNQKFWKT